MTRKTTTTAILSCLLLTGTLMLVLGKTSFSEPTRGKDTFQAEYTVEWPPGTPMSARAQAVTSVSGAIKRHHVNTEVSLVSVPNEAAINSLRHHPSVLSAVHNEALHPMDFVPL